MKPKLSNARFVSISAAALIAGGELLAGEGTARDASPDAPEPVPDVPSSQVLHIEQTPFSAALPDGGIGLFAPGRASQNRAQRRAARHTGSNGR
jgi:hypothetical protein